MQISACRQEKKAKREREEEREREGEREREVVFGIRADKC